MLLTLVLYLVLACWTSTDEMWSVWQVDGVGARVPVPVTMSVKVKPQVKKAGSPPDAAAQPLIHLNVQTLLHFNL